jgi:hypothetical protein
VFFNDCPVPIENLLGKRQEGFKIALNILNSGRIKLAAGSVGGIKFALNKSISYSKERIQFDKSISEFSAIQYKIGEMIRLIFASESAVYRTGKNIDEKEKEFKKLNLPKNEVKLKALREFAIECALLKVYSTEALAYAVDETVQIYGGMGYSAEAGVEMGYRDARITRIYEGTNEINRMLSFAELMKRAFKSKEINLQKAGKSIPKIIFKRSLPFQKLTTIKIIENFKMLFLILSSYTGKAFGMKLADEQEIVMDLADIMGEAYIAESVYLRVEKLKELNFPQNEIDMKESVLNLQLYVANQKIIQKANTIIDSLPNTKK